MRIGIRGGGQLALVLAVLVGAVVAFLVYVVSKSTGDPGEMDVS